MPLTYSIYPNARLLFIRGEGVITQAERVQTMRQWMNDPAYAQCESALCDFSAAQSTPTMAELREVVAFMSREKLGWGPTRLGVVAAKPITFGVANEFSELVQKASLPLEIRVFTDADLAWSWLRPYDPPAG